MALKDLIQRAKQSRLGQAISNLDRDKQKSGFQFTSPTSTVGKIARGYETSKSVTPNFFARTGLALRSATPQSFQQRTSQIAKTKLTPIQQKLTDVPVGFLSGFEKGVGGFTGANDVLRENFFTNAGYKTLKPQTTAGKIAEFGGGVAGYAVGPGKLFNPLEAKVASKITPMLAKPLGQAGSRLGGALAAETTTAALTTPFSAIFQKRGLPETFRDEIVAGLTGRAVGGALGGVKNLVSTTASKFGIKLDKAEVDAIAKETNEAWKTQPRNRGRFAKVGEVQKPELFDPTGVKQAYDPERFTLSERKGGGFELKEKAKSRLKGFFDERGLDIRSQSGEIQLGPKPKQLELKGQDVSSKEIVPENLKSKIEDTLKPEQFQNSKITANKIKTQKQKGLTFQGEQPVRGGSKLRVKPSGEVKVSPSKASSDISISRDKKYAFNINKKKLGLDAKQSKQLDDVVETMRPVLEKNKGKTLTKAEIINGGRKAKVLEDVVGRDEAKSFAESLQASRNLLRSEQSQVGVTPRFLEQLEVVSSVAADAGRRLQAFNIGAEDITIKEKVLRDILKVGADADEVLKAGKNVDWNNAKEITDFYRKFKPATLADKLDEYRYTNMLSSPNTHINNTFSNFLQTAIIAPIEKTIKGATSFAESRLTGKEQEYFARQGVDYAKGYWKSLPEAWQSVKKAFSGQSGLGKPDIDFIPTSTSKLRQIYTLPLTALEASDQFFRTLVKGGEIESLKVEGITGAKASKLAEQSADYRTFRQAFDPEGKLGQNKVLQIWDKWNSAVNNLRNVPGGKYLVPFLQTPTNILKQGVEYSPLGFSTVAGSARPHEQLAKAIIGSSIFSGAYAIANSGLTTWDTPTNATERAEFYAAGLQPYSVKIGDKWVSYSKLGPLAYPIAMASALKWAKDEGGSEEQLANIGNALSGTLGFFADQSYVRGIGDIIDAARGDEFKQARGLSNIPSQMIPYRSAMGWISRLVDPIYRKTSGGSVPEQIKKSLVSQIPFASKSLEAYQTPFGTDSERQFPAANAISPFSITQEKTKEKEYYDARQNIRTQNKEVNKVLKQIEEGKDVSLSNDKMVTDQVVKLTKKKVEAGLDVTQKELETAYIGKTLSMPKSNRYEKANRDSKLWSSYSTIENNEDLSDTQKMDLYEKIATELDRPVEDLQKYQVAKDNNNNKTLYTYDQIDKMQSNEELLNYLKEGRKPINGQILVSDGVIDNLVNDGIIPKQLGKELKNLDYKEDGTLKRKTSSSRGGTSKQSAESKAYSKYLTALSNITLPSGKIRTSGSAPKVGDISGITFGS